MAHLCTFHHIGFCGICGKSNVKNAKCVARQLKQINMQNKIETNDFEKIKTAIFILAESIENGRIQGVCHDVTEALYPDSDVADHSELNQDNK